MGVLVLPHTHTHMHTHAHTHTHKPTHTHAHTQEISHGHHVCPWPPSSFIIRVANELAHTHIFPAYTLSYMQVWIYFYTPDTCTTGIYMPYTIFYTCYKPITTGIKIQVHLNTLNTVHLSLGLYTCAKSSLLLWFPSSWCLKVWNQYIHVLATYFWVTKHPGVLVP